MATTTNFGWETPDDTDLVKDGALAMRTLGNAIDASLVDLKGGTTGQVLSKTSNTDMDFTWVTSDDANAIQNDIVDAKGDLISASAADTPARLAVGNNGETLLADSSTSTGLRWQPTFAAGKNKIINGDFNINQRAFTSTTTTQTYGFDRWLLGTGDGTVTYSAQTFTPGTAPVAGYEAKNFARISSTGQSTTTANSILVQRIEDVRTLAGQTATISFWAKAASGTPKVSVEFQQLFGTGGSAAVLNYVGQVTLSTSWTRYSLTYAIPSIAGKTIGTVGDSLAVALWTSAGTDYNSRTGSLGIQTATIDFWGVQLEAGSVATAFQTATGTLAGELAACEYYYKRVTPTTQYGYMANLGSAISTGAIMATINVGTMRVAPTSLDYSTLAVTGDDATITTTISSATINSSSSKWQALIKFTTAGAITQYRPYWIVANNSTSAYIGLSAEL